MKQILITAIICITAMSNACADNTGENRFIWNESNSLMSRSRDKDDFLRAAIAYNKLLKRDIRNAPLLYNMGTALMMAGQYDHATTFLRRAERYSGTTWEIKRNLQLAQAKGDNSKILPLSWLRHPMFWHYLIPLSTRINIAVYSFTIFWLALTLSKAGCKKSLRAITVLALVALILFGSSAATSIHQENNASILKPEQLTMTVSLESP
jgi:tetratricopeptide (TPR) repeat protein